MTSTDSPSHYDAGTMRLALDGLCALWLCEGVKGLVRRLAATLVSECGVQSMLTAAWQKSSPQTSMAWRSVGLPGVTGFDEALLTDMQTTLKHWVLGDAEWREGVHFFDIQGQPFAMMFLETDDESGQFLMWQMPPTAGQDHRSLLELWVRAAQHEARWYKRLYSTQALIYRDDLTGLFNTRYIEIAIGSEVKRAQRYRLPFSLLFIDLDGFKPINDQHGHLSGSAVLKQVAQVIREVVREIDIPIRYGGDEFVVLLVGATVQTGLLVAERIRKRIAEESFQPIGQGKVTLTCSIGVASYPDHGQDVPTLLKMADENMYRSKKAGKNRVSIVNALSRENSP